MRKPSILLVLALGLTLAACKAPLPPEAKDRLQNPLYAEYYYDELVQTLVDVELKKADIVAKDARMKALLDEERRAGLAKAEEATDRQDMGTRGMLVQAEAFAQGEALLLDNTLYFGPEFNIAPGPEIHLYLSKVVDPRDAETFPTAEDIDVGVLISPYGVQQYATPDLDPAEYRTLAFYDTRLKMLYAFAQLAK